MDDLKFLKETWIERNWGWFFWVILVVLAAVLGVNDIFLLVLVFVLTFFHFLFKDLEEERRQKYREYIERQQLYEHNRRKGF